MSEPIKEIGFSLYLIICLKGGDSYTVTQLCLQVPDKGRAVSALSQKIGKSKAFTAEKETLRSYMLPSCLCRVV